MSLSMGMSMRERMRMLQGIRERSAEYERASRAIDEFASNHAANYGKDSALYVFAFSDRTLGLVGPNTDEYQALLESNVKRRCITKQIRL